MAENGTQPLTGPTLRALAARIDADTRYGRIARLLTRSILEAEAARVERGEA